MLWLEGIDKTWDVRLPVCYVCANAYPIEKEIVMNTGIAKSLAVSAWVEHYKAALLEPDHSKMSERIAEADKALVQRARELFQNPGDHIEEELAMDDAMHALRALRKTYEC